MQESLRQISMASTRGGIRNERTLGVEAEMGSVGGNTGTGNDNNEYNWDSSEEDEQVEDAPGTQKLASDLVMSSSSSESDNDIDNEQRHVRPPGTVDASGSDGNQEDDNDGPPGLVSGVVVAAPKPHDPQHGRMKPSYARMVNEYTPGQQSVKQSQQGSERPPELSLDASLPLRSPRSRAKTKKKGTSIKGMLRSSRRDEDARNTGGSSHAAPSSKAHGSALETDKRTRSTNASAGSDKEHTKYHEKPREDTWASNVGGRALADLDSDGSDTETSDHNGIPTLNDRSRERMSCLSRCEPATPQTEIVDLTFEPTDVMKQVKEEEIYSTTGDCLETTENISRYTVARCFRIVRMVLNIFLGLLFEVLNFSLTLSNKVVVETMATFGHAFFKPVLNATFNHVLQPIFIILLESAKAFKSIAQPLFEAFIPAANVISTALSGFKPVVIHRYNDKMVETL
eukprot:m.654987 g.654987  ORF g.654987 m.654987 type:complete len:456 (+) comp22694_c0_seq7:289-1656(+)